MTATTVKQSKKLLELGFSPNSADMFYTYLEDVVEDMQYNEENIKDEDMYSHYVIERGEWPEEDNDLVAWSVSSLLRLLPPVINGHHLIIEKNIYDATVLFNVFYGGEWSNSKEFKSAHLIIALFDLLVWLKENKYL